MWRSPRTIPFAAGRVRRLGAHALDSLLVGALSAALLHSDPAADLTSAPVALADVLMPAALLAAYSLLFMVVLTPGQTPGKLLAGIRVSGPDGQPLSDPLRVLVREVCLKGLLVTDALAVLCHAPALAALGGVLLVFGALLVLFAEDGTAGWDTLCVTAVEAV